MAGAGAEHWWQTAESNLRSAVLLKDAGQANEAYHLAGQAVEFGLKALYLKRNNLSEMPGDHRGAHWHDLSACANAARLPPDLNRTGTSKGLRVNWLTVRDWRSNARFPGWKVSRRQLNDFFAAVCNDQDGVWPWLREIYLRA